MTRPEIEPRSPGPLANTLPTRPMSRFIYIYIYIYIYMQYIWIFLYIYIYIYIYWQHFFININFVEHNRHFLSTYFLVDHFILPYWFYWIRRELVDVSSIIISFPSTFCPTLGHHRRRFYNKSDVTFVCILLLCKKSVYVVAVCSVYF